MKSEKCKNVCAFIYRSKFIWIGFIIYRIEENKDKTIRKVFDTFNEEQKTAVYAIINRFVDDSEESDTLYCDNNPEISIKSSSSLVYATFGFSEKRVYKKLVKYIDKNYCQGDGNE